MAYKERCKKCGRVLRYDFEIEIEICEMCEMKLIRGIVLPPLKQKGEQETDENIT